MKHLKIPARILYLTVCYLAISALQLKPAITVLADTGEKESSSDFWKNQPDSNGTIPDKSGDPENDVSDDDVSDNNEADIDETDSDETDSDDKNNDESDADDADWGSFDTDDADWGSFDTDDSDQDSSDTDDSDQDNSDTDDADSDEKNHADSEDKHPSSDNDTPGSVEPSEPDEIPSFVTASVRPLKSSQTALLRWKPFEDAYAYKVQRSDDKNGKYKNIASLGKDKATYTDTSVKRGRSYFYRIVAKLKNGGNCYSKALSFTRPLSPVGNIRLIRYSTSSVKVLWEESGENLADCYKVYYAKNKSGSYKLAGTTKNTWYRVKDLKNNQDYYFRVKACAAKKASPLDSEFSTTTTIRTKPYQRTTIFAGDSLTVGFRTYNVLNEMAIGGNKRVVAAVGLNTTTFRTRRVFDGKSGLESIVSSKPYRVYLMLGDNDIHYRSKEDVLAAYQVILKGIRTGSPDTDIVVLAASPVTSAQVAKRKGFAQIPAYNQGLKALAESMGARYFDCTAFLKDTNGCLKSSYDAGDGIHWKAAVYHEYAGLLEAYDKSLDENEKE